MKSFFKIINETYAFFIPVIICILVYLSPNSFQEKMIFSPTTFNWWNWFTHIFVHESLTHLLSNIIIYSIAILLTYQILPIEERKLNWFLVILILLVTPIVSLISQSYLFQGYNRGFSGITAAGLGFLCLAISRRIHLILNNDNKKMSLVTSSYLIIFPSLAFFILNLSVILSLIPIFCWIIWMFLIVHNIKNKRAKIRLTIPNNKDFMIIIIGVIILLLGISSLVPQTIKQSNGSIVNILAHFIGFFVGFFILLFKYFIYFSRKTIS